MKLTLAEFIKLAENNDIKFSQILNSKTSDLYYDLHIPANTTAISVISENETNHFNDKRNNYSNSFTGSFNQEFYDKGHSINASFNTIKMQSSISKKLELNFKASIFNNYRGENFNIQSRTVDLEYKIKQFENDDKKEEYYKEIMDLYLEFKIAYLKLRIAENGYSEAQKLHNYIEEKRKKNIALKVDVLKSKLQLVQHEDTLINAKNQYERYREKINYRSGLSENFEFDFNISSEFDHIKIEDIKGEGHTFRFEKIKQYKEEIARNDLKILKSQSDPDIYFVAGFGAEEINDIDALKSISGSFGVEFSMLLGDTKNSAEKIDKLNHINTLNLDENYLRSRANKNMDFLLASLDALKKSIELSKIKMELVTELLKEDQKRFEYNKIELDKLIETKTTVMNSKLELQSKKLEYDKYIVELLFTTNRLLSFKDQYY